MEEALHAAPNLDGLADSEDLFGFDAAPVREGAVEGRAADELGEADDLFDFDEILATDGSAEHELDVGAIVAELQSPDSTTKVREATHRADAGDELVPIQAPYEERVAAAPVRASRGRSAPVAALLIAFAALNLALVGFTWKLSTDVRDRVDAATVDIRLATQSLQQQTETRPSADHGEDAGSAANASSHEPDDAQPEGDATFLRVDEDLASGDYAGARRRLYALLAVADRLDPAVREDVVARARFRLGDTLLAQALATEGGRP